MPIGPSWLTSWVKTNSKHVIYAPDKLEKNTSENASPTTATSTANSSTAISSNDIHRRYGDDPGMSAVRNVSNRKHRRRLVKTRSATDMIVEMANARNESHSDSSQISELKTTANSSSGYSVTTETASVKSDLSPLRLVAGLFGTAVDHDDSMRQLDLSQKPQYLNEAAFTLQREQQQQKLKQSHESESALAPGRSKEGSFGSAKGHDSQQHVGGLANLKFMQQPFFGRADAEVERTAHLESLESQLAATLDDLEYIRGVALSNEADRDRKSETANAEEQPVVLPSRKLPSSTLVEASKQLNEVISRHKKEVEQLTKERCRWQQDVHFKLNKFANLCKDLNEESANRNEEAIGLRKDLESVRTERDSMSEELTRLRAQVQFQEKQIAEYAETKKKLREYEDRGLDRAEDAIQSRDQIISDLSSKLEQSLDLLVMEREQQRQRRQIIFPASRSLQASCSSHTLHC